ncbi:hypothetical protein ACFPJ1_42560 [Kribbella qitaiheensis]|uniref:hypothetical protein n=1 Tax=Kribbella qitaiheensis TaxID=1544730 RepID=UPI0036153CE7
MITTSGRHHADLGVPLAKAIDAYRAGGRFIWEALVAEAHATRSLSSEALVRAASRIWLILDDFTDAMADAYRDAVAERIVAQEHERSALVAALLEGRITENETLWEAAEMLRISAAGDRSSWSPRRCRRPAGRRSPRWKRGCGRSTCRQPGD